MNMTSTSEQQLVGDEDGPRILTAAWRGQRALRGLETLAARAGPRLEIDARALEVVDSFTGVVLREAIDTHIAADPGHSAVVQEPRDTEAWARLSDAVGSLPRRARWAGAQPAAHRARQVLLPATRIEDSETAMLLAHWLTVVTAATRLPTSESRLLQLAAATFADNALLHAAEDDAPALMGACRDPQGNDLQVVALSRGVPAAAMSDPREFMRDIANRSKRDLGGLFSLDQLAQRRGIDATLRLAAGRARLFSRGQRFRIDGDAPNVPAFASSLEIHLPAS